MNSRLTGYVTRVTVDDNQYVEAGTVLVQLVELNLQYTTIVGMRLSPQHGRLGIPMNTNDTPGVETEIDRNSANRFRSRLEVASNDVTIGN